MSLPGNDSLSSTAAHEEAATWLARRDRGLSPDEQAGLREWAKRPANRQALSDMARCWHGMDNMAVLAELFPLPPVHEAAPRRRFPITAVAAASLACLLVMAAIFVAGRRSAETINLPEQAATAIALDNQRYATGVGETRTIRLGDGSTLTLNTSSQARVRYSPVVRDVFLEHGEANFEVARDITRPFNVHAGNRVLQAVGTAFNVRLLGGGHVELTVTEGKVRVLPEVPHDETAASGEATVVPTAVLTTIAAQETATVGDSEQTVRRLEPAELDVRLAWQRGMLIFKGETLEYVLAEFDRYTDAEFVLADESLRDVRVGGYFRAGDIEGLLLALRTNFNVDSQRLEANRIVLSAAPTR